MANDSEFWGQYKHPLWQKKRLYILEKHGFTCENCGAEDKQLHAHHRYYTPKTKIWDYPDDCYECLCEDCHKHAHEIKARIKESMSKLPGNGPEVVLGFINAIMYDHAVSEGFSFELKADSLEEACGISSYFRCSIQEIVEIAKNNNGVVYKTEVIE